MFASEFQLKQRVHLLFKNCFTQWPFTVLVCVSAWKRLLLNTPILNGKYFIRLMVKLDFCICVNLQCCVVNLFQCFYFNSTIIMDACSCHVLLPLFSKLKIYRYANSHNCFLKHQLLSPAQNSTLTIEEFHSKLQEATNFPLRPFVIPFLKVREKKSTHVPEI